MSYYILYTFLWRRHFFASSLRSETFTCGWVQCTLGCSDFNNFIMPTLGWLPNFCPRHVYKRRFSFFWAILCSFSFKFSKKVLIRTQKIVCAKIQLGHQQTQTFMRISNMSKKLLTKKRRRKEVFQLLIFCEIFLQLCNRFEINKKICIFHTPAKLKNQK
jgi:hypothetical protein